jgi:hypothetical protein
VIGLLLLLLLLFGVLGTATGSNTGSRAERSVTVRKGGSHQSTNTA